MAETLTRVPEEVKAAEAANQTNLNRLKVRRIKRVAVGESHESCLNPVKKEADPIRQGVIYLDPKRASELPWDTMGVL